MGLHLDERFYKREKGKFAGGIERAFMSTTSNPEVAFDYSGGAHTKGSILALDFDMASRGAAIDWLSQFPHERELIFPPNTMLECTGYSTRGTKRLVMVRATVSTAMPDTSGIEKPDDVPAVHVSDAGGSTSEVEGLAALLEGCAMTANPDSCTPDL